MRKTILSALAALTMFVPVSRTVTVPDCEEIDRLPCAMFDEGAWRLVKSFDPYRAQKAKLVNKRGNYVTVRVIEVRRVPQAWGR